MNARILLLGYGTAGRIHKEVLERLGYDVVVVEKDVRKTEGLANRCFLTLDAALSSDARPAAGFFLYDICVGTADHAACVLQLLSRENRPNIIVEKPLVNAREQLDCIKDLVAQGSCSLFVNENYLFLSSYPLLKSILQRHAFTLHDISLEFTKDREHDLRNNRFIDEQLFAAGIEGTHMLAVLDQFCDVKSLPLLESACDRTRFYARYALPGGGTATLRSSLDGRRHCTDDICAVARDKLRILILDGAEGKRIIVLFGSSADLRTRIAVYDCTTLVEEHVLEDTSMSNSLSHAVRSFREDATDATLEKNIIFTERLLELVEHAVRVDREDTDDDISRTA